MVKKVKKEKKKKEKKIADKDKLITILQKALLDAGYEVERDGWTENSSSVPPHDECEWLDASLFDREGNKIDVHFYFSRNSTRLENLEIFKSKEKSGFNEPKLLARQGKFNF